MLFSETLEAIGTRPITWTLAADALPAGLALSNGVISGTPAVYGTFTFTVRAENTAGYNTQQLSIVIARPSLNVSNLEEWRAAVTVINEGGDDAEYVINIIDDFARPGDSFTSLLGGHGYPTFAPSNLTVTIQGSQTMSLSPGGGSLLAVTANQTIILRDLILQGIQGGSSLIYIHGGTVTMQGSSQVTGNRPAAGNGGGVNVSDGGTFTMQDNARVHDNRRGGVQVGGDGTSFIMEGNSQVHGHNEGTGPVTHLMAGVIVRDNASFIMRGNAAVHNNVGRGGGGVRVVQGAAFTMEDSSSVRDNDAITTTGNLPANGGGVFVDGVFTMSGNASVSGNSGMDGGGVFVVHGFAGAPGGTFIMQGGTIYGNSAMAGGGVYVQGASGTSGGVFQISEGTIYGNNAGDYSNEGGSLRIGPTSTAQHGTFNHLGLFTFAGDLSTSNNTIRLPIPTVTNVSVSPSTAFVIKGQTRQFSAVVSGTNNPDTTVTWDVTGGGTGTSISESGLLTVAADESAASLDIIATSILTPSISGMATAVPIDFDNPLILTQARWVSILEEIADDNDFDGTLDLSSFLRNDSTTGAGLRSNGTFDPWVEGQAAAKARITRLILPDDATGIVSGTGLVSPFRNFENLTEVSGSGIITIGNAAFLRASSLTTANFPWARTIGGAAFADSGLIIADFPNVTSIPNTMSGGGVWRGVFEGASSLTKANFPLVTSIGSNAFSGATSLATANFPLAETIGEAAFANTGLIIADFPKVSSLLRGFQLGVFEGASNLTTANFPQATSIGERAFINASSLTTVYFPLATSIGWDAFSGASSLEKVTFGIAHVTGFLLPIANLIEANFPLAETIGSNVFRNASRLTTANLPLVTSIGNNAFEGASRLTTVYSPLVTSIDNSAFRNASSLTTADFPLVETIGSSAFDGASSLTTANFPLATSIGSIAFIFASSLTTADFPLVTSIGNGAFSHATSLTTANFPQATSTGQNTFNGASSLTTANFPLVETIGYRAFNGAIRLTIANFPMVTHIEGRAFENTGRTPLIITMGATPPALQGHIFRDAGTAANPKNITVRVPNPAAYTANWREGFRGRGWSPPDNRGTGTANNNVTVTVVGF